MAALVCPSTAPSTAHILTQYRYTFDIIGELFFGQKFGFMEKSHDHQSWILSLDTMLPVMTSASAASPAVRGVILGSSMFSSTVRAGLQGLERYAAAARACVAARLDVNGNEKSATSRTDLLHHLLEIVRVKGDALDYHRNEVEYECMGALYDNTILDGGL